MTQQSDEAFQSALAGRARQALQHWHTPAQEPVLLKYRENAVFRITLPDGAYAALRLHRPGYHGDAALHSELTLMAVLRAKGLNVPVPLPSRDGNLIVALSADDDFPQHFADIVSWMEGEPVGETGALLSGTGEEQAELYFRIGAVMAQMHIMADGFTPPEGFFRPAWDRAGLVGEQPLWGRFWDSPLLTKHQAEALADLRTRLDRRFETAISSDLDYGLIHADLVRENVRVHNGDIAFIDFDDCGYGFRLFDLATSLLKNRHEPAYPLIEKALIAGYRSRRALSDAELQQLPLFLTLRSLTYIGWISQRPELADVEARLSRYIAESLQLAEIAGV